MYIFSPRVLRFRQRAIVVLLGACFVLGLGLVALCIWVTVLGLGIRDRVEPVRGWPQAAGWVAGFHTYQGDSGPYYRPVIAFRADNRVIRFDAPTTTTEPPVVGSRALVSYDPLNPADAHDLSMGSGAWELPFYGGIIFLVVVLALGFFFTRQILRVRRRRGGSPFVRHGRGAEGKHVRGSAF
jgi:hypothetical protein